MNQKIESLFANWGILRINMFIESEKFKADNKDKYDNKFELNKALRKYINRKFKEDSKKLTNSRFNLF